MTCDAKRCLTRTSYLSRASRLEREKSRERESLRASQAVHEHTAHKIVHRIRHPFESSGTIRISRKFALLARYFLQSSHQEHPSVYARCAAAHRPSLSSPSSQNVRKTWRTLVRIDILISLCIPPVLLPFLQLTIDCSEICFQLWVDVAKRCIGIVLLGVRRRGDD